MTKILYALIKSWERLAELDAECAPVLSMCAEELTQLIAGKTLVPTEPTLQMLTAAAKYEDFCAIHNYGGSADADGIWQAMLEAADEST